LESPLGKGTKDKRPQDIKKGKKTFKKGAPTEVYPQRRKTREPTPGVTPPGNRGNNGARKADLFKRKSQV